MRRKRKRKPRVEVPFSPEEDAKAELLMIELDMSKAEVMKLGLSEEGRYQLEQAEARVSLRSPHLRSKALADSDIRARAQRSARYLESKETEEQKAQRQLKKKAKTILEAGARFYDVEKATGLSRSEVTRLEQERRAANEAATRTALNEMEQHLENQPPNAGRDELARRIGVLRGEEEEDKPEAWGLRELNVHALSRLFY